jgi:hypothetical protein
MLQYRRGDRVIKTRHALPSGREDRYGEVVQRPTGVTVLLLRIAAAKTCLSTSRLLSDLALQGLSEGQTVVVDVVEGRKGFEAARVRLVE